MKHGKFYESNILPRYGLTIADVEAMYEDQEGLCGICAEPLPNNTTNTVIDHDHDTKAVRGLLHRGCNNKLEWAYAHRERIAEWIEKRY